MDKFIVVKTGTLEKVASYNDRKDRKAKLRGLPNGKYDVIQVAEVGLEIGEPNRVVTKVIRAGASTSPRPKKTKAEPQAA